MPIGSCAYERRLAAFGTGVPFALAVIAVGRIPHGHCWQQIKVHCDPSVLFYDSIGFNLVNSWHSRRRDPRSLLLHF